MLEITIPATEKWDWRNEEFVYIKETTLKLEHSLVSLSKWESQWHKPFLSNKSMSIEETIDYIRCMTVTQNVSPMVYSALTDDNIRAVEKYIDDPMTATWFSESQSKKKKDNKIVTAEIIYYWMFELKIPMECQKWHLNRLLTLIRVCNEENKPKKKMSKKEIMERNRVLNEARKKQLNTKG